MFIFHSRSGSGSERSNAAVPLAASQRDSAIHRNQEGQAPQHLCKVKMARPTRYFSRRSKRMAVTRQQFLQKATSKSAVVSAHFAMLNGRGSDRIRLPQRNRHWPHQTRTDRSISTLSWLLGLNSQTWRSTDPARLQRICTAAPPHVLPLIGCHGRKGVNRSMCPQSLPTKILFILRRGTTRRCSGAGAGIFPLS